MHNVLNDFYEDDTKYSEQKILLNCKNFLSYRAISPDHKILGFTRKIVKKNYKNSRKNEIRLISKKDSKLKLVSLSSLNLSQKDGNKFYNRNKRYEDLFSRNNNFKSNSMLKSEFISKIKIKNKLINKLNNSGENNKNKKLEKFIDIFKKFEKNKKPLFCIRSAKNISIDNNKNINSRIIKSKVNDIVKNLLSNKTPKSPSKDSPKNLFPLNLSINPFKYIESIMIKDPHNKKLFKSYDKQVKYLMDKNVRNSLIDGVNDYKENLQRYSKIYFDNFSRINNLEQRENQNKIKKILLNERYQDIKNTNYNKKDIKLYNSSYFYNYEKFKNNYLKEYEERKFNKNNYVYNDKNINNTDKKYFKFMNNHNFYKMISIEGKLKNMYISAKDVIKNSKRDTLKKLRKKYLL